MLKNEVKGTFMGMGLCTISTVLVSYSSSIVSEMKDYHPLTKTLWRFVGTFFLSIFVCLFYALRGVNIAESFWPLRKRSVMVIISLFFRSWFGCTASAFQYYSLKYMDLGDSAVICNSYPVLVSIIAYIFLGEPFGFFAFFCALVTFSGVILIMRPPFLTGENFDSDLMVGVALAIGCSFFLSFAIVMIRHLKDIHHSITLIGYGGFGMIESIALAAGFGVLDLPRGEIDYVKASAIGVLTCTSQLFLIFALKCDKCGPVSLVKTSDVIFAFIWQMAFQKIFPDYISIIGALVMMTGIVLCGFVKYVDSLEKDHQFKKLCWFMLK